MRQSPGATDLGNRNTMSSSTSKGAASEHADMEPVVENLAVHNVATRYAA